MGKSMNLEKPSLPEDQLNQVSGGKATRIHKTSKNLFITDSGVEDLEPDEKEHIPQRN